MFAYNTIFYSKLDDGINDTREKVSAWIETNKLAINKDNTML